MVLTEFDEIKYAEVLREDGRMDGFKEGHKEGHKEGLEEGHKKGLLEGKFLSICELVNDGLLPLEEALKRVDMNEKDFKEAALHFGFKIK